MYNNQLHLLNIKYEALMHAILFPTHRDRMYLFTAENLNV